jgi:hypothetical protein
MKTGYIKIIFNDGKTPIVDMQLVNGDLWLTKFEIAHLFGCFVQKIDANLKSIFKERLLWKNDCVYCNRYIDKGIEKQTEYYNLDVLIFLSYRINTCETKIFCRFINSALHERLTKDTTPEMFFSLAYLPARNKYWLN